MLREHNIPTPKEGCINITRDVSADVSESKIKSGMAIIFTPHTTAAITINENADPDVRTDLQTAMDRAFPGSADFRHSEGNSAAHCKSSVFGPSLSVIIENGRLLLGTWQGIYFCEFDGPRSRRYYVKILED